MISGDYELVPIRADELHIPELGQMYSSNSFQTVIFKDNIDDPDITWHQGPRIPRKFSHHRRPLQSH